MEKVWIWWTYLKHAECLLMKNHNEENTDFCAHIISVSRENLTNISESIYIPKEDSKYYSIYSILKNKQVIYCFNHAMWWCRTQLCGTYPRLINYGTRFCPFCLMDSKIQKMDISPYSLYLCSSCNWRYFFEDSCQMFSLVFIKV